MAGLQSRILLTAFSPTASTLLPNLQEALNPIFSLPIDIQPEVKPPTLAFSSKRQQYLADAFFPILASLKEHSEDHVLGITHHDLYVGTLNFVFGTAHPDLGVAVVSTKRLMPEFYGQPANSHLFWKRITTESVHELGHTFGLGHCSNPHCVMFFSNHILDTDRKGAQFCLKCQRQLRTKLR